MAPNQIQLFKVRVRSFKTVLQGASEKAKQESASIVVAKNFNAIIEEIGEAFPVVRSALPKKIEATNPLAELGASDANYIDLEIYAEQIIGILDLLDENKG